MLPGIVLTGLLNPVLASALLETGVSELVFRVLGLLDFSAYVLGVRFQGFRFVGPGVNKSCLTLCIITMCWGAHRGNMS